MPGTVNKLTNRSRAMNFQKTIYTFAIRCRFLIFVSLNNEISSYLHVSINSSRLRISTVQLNVIAFIHFLKMMGSVCTGCVTHTMPMNTFCASFMVHIAHYTQHM